jgi:hypothetical protein
VAEPTVSFRQFSLADLRKHLDRRHFAVPKLQREFVWNGKKAAQLLDSIYRGLPIGALTIWLAPRPEQFTLRRTLHVLPDYSAKRNRDIWFLIDGQQRLSVIHQAFAAESKTVARRREVDFGRLCFRTDSVASIEKEDAEEGTPISLFAYRRADDESFVPVRDVLSSRWRRRLSHIGAQRLKRVEEARQKLLRYKVPATFFHDGSLETVRELFVRINSLGTRVTAADRVFSRAAAFDIRERARDDAQRLPEGFRELSDEALLQLLSLTQGKDEVGERAYEQAARRVEDEAKRSEKVSGKADGKSRAGNKAVDKHWSRMHKALGQACDYLKQEFAVEDHTWLPSVYMPVLLALYFFSHGRAPGSKDKVEIRKWFWATAVGKRYSGRGYRPNIAADAAFFRRLARGKARFVFSDRVEKDEIRRTEYGTGSALAAAFFCLLALQKPAFLSTGEPIPLHRGLSRANRKQRHHVFPRALLSRLGLGPAEFNSLCNLAWVVADDNLEFGARPPGAYLADYRGKRFFARALRTHLLPPAAEGWLTARPKTATFRQFVAARRELIVRAFERAAGTKLFR